MNIIIDNVIKNEKESKRTYDRLYVLIELLSKMDIPVVVFNKIIACMKDKSIMEIIVSRRNTMLNFIIRQYKRGNITVENKEIKETFYFDFRTTGANKIERSKKLFDGST